MSRIDTLVAKDRAEVSAIMETIEPCALHYKTAWVCDKYEQDKVDFVISELRKRGDNGVIHRVGGDDIWRPFEDGVPSDLLAEFDVTPDDILVVPGNLLLNEGLQRLRDLLVVAGGTGYNNANAFIGVGDTNTAEAASQTELQAAAAATNRFYKGMNATFPATATQAATWASDFTTTEANFVWAEWTVSAAATSASGAGFLTGTTNLNRKVASLGTKVTGTWTLSVTITFS